MHGTGGSKSLTSMSDLRTAQNPKSNWKAVLASAGISAVEFDEQKPMSNAASVGSAPMQTPSLAGGPAQAPGSTQHAPSPTNQSNSGATRSPDAPGSVLPAISGMTGPGLVIQVQKTQPQSPSREAGDASRADHAGKHLIAESNKKPTCAVLDPATTALPVITFAPVTLEPAKVPTQNQFASSLTELRTGQAFDSAAPHPTVPETNTSQIIMKGAAGIEQAGGTKNDESQLMPISTHVQSIDTSADLASAKGPHSGAFLETAAPPSTPQEASFATPLATARPELLAPNPEALSGSFNQNNEFPITASTAREPRTTSAGGGPSKQAAQPAGRTGALPAAAIEATRSFNHSSVQEQSALSPMRDPAGIQTLPGAFGNTVSATASSPTNGTASSVRDLFVTLDGARGETTPAWIHAGARAAEAGYQDPALGWVGVRAQADINGVHASLVPNSADAAQILGGHLSGLNAYLTEHRTPVETLTMSAPESRSNGQGFEQGSQQSARQGSSAGEHSGQPDRYRASLTAVNHIGANASEDTAGRPPGGVYVSVMALNLNKTQLQSQRSDLQNE